jgi:type I restriction enzyme R subunit
MPIFRMLKREIFGDADNAKGAMVAEPPGTYGTSEEERISQLVALTQHVYAEVERELKLTGFWESVPARNKLKADIQKAILQPEFAALPGITQKRAQIISRVMEIAEKNHDTIVYGA